MAEILKYPQLLYKRLPDNTEIYEHAYSADDCAAKVAAGWSETRVPEHTAEPPAEPTPEPDPIPEPKKRGRPKKGDA